MGLLGEGAGQTILSIGVWMGLAVAVFFCARGLFRALSSPSRLVEEEKELAERVVDADVVDAVGDKPMSQTAKRDLTFLAALVLAGLFLAVGSAYGAKWTMIFAFFRFWTWPVR